MAFLFLFKGRRNDMNREEFLDRFIRNQDVNLDEVTATVEDKVWVLTIKGKIYEGILVRLQKLIEKNSGDFPLYMHIVREDELVHIGNIERSVGVINEMLYITRVLKSELYEKDGEDYREVSKEDYIENIKLDKMGIKDYLT